MLKALMGSFAASLAALFLSAASVSAQDWPNKPVTILMGFPAGEESVRKLKDIRPAAEIIEEMMADARDILEADGRD